MRHHLALTACILLTGSVALGAPSAKHRAKAAASTHDPVERDEAEDGDEIEMEPVQARFGSEDNADAEDEDADEAPVKAKRRPARTARALDVDDEPEDEGDEDTTEAIRAPVKLRTRGLAKQAKDWHVAIGPYVWASSVDAEVSLGSASVGSGVDFMDLKRHTRFGAELLAAVSYRRFKLSSDMMYGVIDLDGAKTVGPLMVSLNGTASSLLVDGNLSYTLTGGDQSLLSLEALAGVRYQRTSIEGAVSLGGSQVASMEKVTNVADAIAGARVFVRPFNRLYATASFDMGVFGDSSLTWSASGDASVRITSRVLFSLGYRALTMNGANVSMKMHGPRAALQLLF
ncbi:MAG: hypothetical protein ABI175_08730 [Polyangiales bacterium]